MFDRVREGFSSSFSQPTQLQRQQQEINALQSRNTINVGQVNPHQEQLQNLEKEISNLEKQLEVKEGEKEELNLVIKKLLREGKEATASRYIKKRNTINEEITLIQTTIAKNDEVASNLRKIKLIDQSKRNIRDANYHIQKFVKANEDGKEDDLTDIIYDDKYNSASIDKMISTYNLSFGDSLSNNTKETQDEIERIKREIEQEDNDKRLSEIAKPQSQPSYYYPNIERSQQQQQYQQPQSKKPSLLDAYGLT